MENNSDKIPPELEALQSRAEVTAPGFSFKIEDLGWKELIALGMILVFLYIIII